MPAARSQDAIRSMSAGRLVELQQEACRTADRQSFTPAPSLGRPFPKLVPDCVETRRL